MKDRIDSVQSQELLEVCHSFSHHASPLHKIYAASRVFVDFVVWAWCLYSATVQSTFVCLMIASLYAVGCKRCSMIGERDNQHAQQRDFRSQEVHIQLNALLHSLS